MRKMHAILHAANSDERGHTTKIRQPLIARILFVVLAGALVHTVESRTSSSLKVTLSHGGVLVGRHLTSHSGRHIRAFMGVPYAVPPVDDLRFKAPVPFGTWSGERPAVEDSAKCIQRDPYRRDIEIEGSEDCLYLNVYTPDSRTLAELEKPLPTMVWFHGGGWQCGSGISSFYGPDFLLDHNVILVSANFRLGPIGFLSTETLDCPGNFGLKDQTEVLRWVQQNIQAFGGNPRSVTIFGESAGGASVTYHMMSRQTRGLFHRGIAQSGTLFNPWAQPAHQGIPAERAHRVAELVGCESIGEHTGWPETMKCLRSKPAEDIVATVYQLFEWDTDPMIPFPPVVEPDHDEAFLTIPPRSEIHPHGMDLPLMIGATSEEGVLKTAALLNLPGLLDQLKSNFDKILPIVLYYDHHPREIQQRITRSIEQFYFPEGHTYDKINHQNLTDLISDGWFIAGVDEYLRLRLGNKLEGRDVSPTYVYLFEHKGAASFSEIFKGGRNEYYGTCHAEELQYLFPIGRELFVSAVPTEADLRVREMLLQIWVNFANTGDPNPISNRTDTVSWEPTPDYPVNYLRIGSKNLNSQTHSELVRIDRSMYQARADFWNNIKAHLSPNRTAGKTRDEL